MSWDATPDSTPAATVFPNFKPARNRVSEQDTNALSHSPQLNYTVLRPLTRLMTATMRATTNSR